MERMVALLGIAAVACACSVVGPNAIRNGRMAYNEAIRTTNDEQLLMVAVHDRYEENASLLAVASVTANMHTIASAGVEAGYGGGENYRGNLVPFSAEMVYEENPTISYVPVAGAKYTRQVMAPISLATLAQFTGTLEDPAGIYAAFIAKVNGIENPDFATRPADPRFARFVGLMAQLTTLGCLHWVETKPGEFAIAIERCGAEHVAAVAALLDILDIPISHATNAGMVLPVALGLKRNSDTDITLITRSILDLMELLSAAIDVPDADLESGITKSYGPPGEVGSHLEVTYSKDRPQHASVAVPYRDGWFYIDERDRATKRFFRVLTTLWTITIAENTGTSNAPLLTVPVSR